jgi:sulfite dehydrogenase
MTPSPLLFSAQPQDCCCRKGFAAGGCNSCRLPASAAEDADKMAIGKQLFTASRSGSRASHTLKDAGSEGAVGSVFDDLKPNAARVKALYDGLGASH